MTFAGDWDAAVIHGEGGKKNKKQEKKKQTMTSPVVCCVFALCLLSAGARPDGAKLADDAERRVQGESVTALCFRRSI